MPTSSDLVGLGVPGELAVATGNDPLVITCTGTAQGTAALIRTHNSELNAQASQTGAILPAAAKIGTPFYFQNSTLSTQSAVVYVPVGQFLGGTVNNSFTIAAGKAAYMMKYKANNWSSNLTA